MGVPALGPIFPGDKSVLDQDLTHATTGLPLYPAFDGGWVAGGFVIAPEDVRITRHSGGTWAGWSIYATGKSGMRYYITHLRSERAAVGSTVTKGSRMGVVGNFEGARVPHGHVGINVELLLGEGVQLKHNTNYTHGQPTVGTQLKNLLPKEVDDLVDADRLDELEKAAIKQIETGIGPGTLPEQERLIFWSLAQNYDRGKQASGATLCAEKLAQIKAIVS